MMNLINFKHSQYKVAGKVVNFTPRDSCKDLKFYIWCFVK